MDKLLKDGEIMEEVENFDDNIGLEIHEAVIDEISTQETCIEQQDELSSTQTEEMEYEEIILGCENESDEMNSGLFNVNTEEPKDERLDNAKTSYEELERYFNSVTGHRKIGVYAKVDEEGFITKVVSDIFTKNLEGFVKIDEGEGDKFVYAENIYFNEPLIDDNGKYRYKLETNNGAV